MTQIHPTPTVLALVSDVYSAFTCKGGTCRNTCCQGWKVSLPMTQYFKLANLSCDPTFQERISRSLRLSLTPSPESYGEFAHDYQGRCPLLSAEGLCDLHAKCGETALPSVCRQYPRSHRNVFGPEASVVNSCERTLELLFSSKEPLSFHLEAMQEDLFPNKKNIVPSAESAARRAAALSVLSDRSMSFPNRMWSLWSAMSGHATRWTAPLNDALSVDELGNARRMLRTMIETLTLANRSIEELTEQTASFLYENDVEQTYGRALSLLNESLPDHAIYFEKLFVNHLFYRGFPDVDPSMTEQNAVEALIGTYAILRYITLAMVFAKRTMEGFVDIVAKVFRVAAHSRFEPHILGLMRDVEGDSPEALRVLCAF